MKYVLGEEKTRVELQGITRIGGFDQAVLTIRANPQWSLCRTETSPKAQGKRTPVWENSELKF
jgi:hypothetical protein